MHEGHDPKNRIVFICKDEGGAFYVYKPRTMFKSRSWATVEDAELQACFARQCGDSQNQASYQPGEAVADGPATAAGKGKGKGKGGRKPARK